MILVAEEEYKYYSDSQAKMKYKKKHILNLWVLPLYYEKFVAMTLLMNINTTLYILFILPLRTICGFFKLLTCCWKRNERMIFDMYYYMIILIVTFTFMYISDTSSMYHWIKGKSFVKLYSFFVILDISDILNRNIGKDLVYSLSHKIHYGKTAFRVSFLICIYGLIHSFVLVFQLLTLNSIFKSGRDTFLLFLLSNNVAEIKVYVFKKVDTKILYDFTCRDTNERAQQLIYFLYIIILNNRYVTNDHNLMHRILLTFLAEFFVDWLKHFLMNALYKIPPQIYLNYRYILSKMYINSKERREIKEGIRPGVLDDEEHEDIMKDLNTEIKTPTSSYHAYVNYEFLKDCNEVKDIIIKDWSNDLMLMRNNMNELYQVSMFQNFMIIPQVVLIIRLTIDFLRNNEFWVSETVMFLVIVTTVGWFWEKVVSRILAWSCQRIVKEKYFT